MTKCGISFPLLIFFLGGLISVALATADLGWNPSADGGANENLSNSRHLTRTRRSTCEPYGKCPLKNQNHDCQYDAPCDWNKHKQFVCIPEKSVKVFEEHKRNPNKNKKIKECQELNTDKDIKRPVGGEMAQGSKRDEPPNVHDFLSGKHR